VLSRPTCALVVVVLLAGATAALRGQLAERPLIDALAHPAIGYFTRPTTDVVGGLARRVEAGAAALTFDEGSGYLKSVLAALHVPVESQMLVMSKTGVQGLYTGPDNPRAIYFNDTVTVGYIRGAPFLELATHDPEQGVVFYTIDQKPESPLERRRGCMNCHQVFATLHVPGLLLRSSAIAPDGLPIGQFGGPTPDDRTPFRRRFGGWYVTGTHGAMRHMGNAIVAAGGKAEDAVSDRTLNRTSLDGLFDARTYPSALSDIAALMVFQHQVRLTNLITRIGWDARLAAHAHTLDVAGGPMREGLYELVDALLFVDEDPLTDAVKGTSGFAEIFSAQGPADSRGRSLRQLDLERRLLRYPCSYMIYSPAFRALPADVRQAIYRRMWEILSARETGAKYARLSDDDRRAVAEILRDTVPDLRDTFRASDRLR
jgi:hypothetical protein